MGFFVLFTVCEGWSGWCTAKVFKSRGKEEEEGGFGADHQQHLNKNLKLPHEGQKCFDTTGTSRCRRQRSPLSCLR